MIVEYDYTPTTDDVQFSYAMHEALAPVRMGVRDRGDKLGPSLDAFDRWLNEERAKVWEQVRAEIRMLPSWYDPETGKGGFDLQPLGPDESSEEGAWNAIMAILDKNPYRKDAS